MDCFHDFCLACDRESDSLYCSQACRLADLSKASLPPSPTSSNLPSNQTSSSLACSGLGTGSGYVLAPAFKFPDRTPGYSQPTAADGARPQSSYFMGSSAEQSSEDSQPQRSLSPSSSRSSLSSTGSSSNPNVISERAKLELQEYFSSFDHAKAAKRRQSNW